jgi:hypothetical protein
LGAIIMATIGAVLFLYLVSMIKKAWFYKIPKFWGHNSKLFKIW